MRSSALVIPYPQAAVEDTSYGQGAVELDGGDVLVLYTDGLPDAARPDDARFGMDRLRQAALDHHYGSAAEIVAALEEAVNRYSGSAEQFDDMAILVARRTGGQVARDSAGARRR